MKSRAASCAFVRGILCALLTVSSVLEASKAGRLSDADVGQFAVIEPTTNHVGKNGTITFTLSKVDERDVRKVATLRVNEDKDNVTLFFLLEPGRYALALRYVGNRLEKDLTVTQIAIASIDVDLTPGRYVIDGTLSGGSATLFLKSRESTEVIGTSDAVPISRSKQPKLPYALP